MKTNTRVIRIRGDILGIGPTAERNGEKLCEYCAAFSFCEYEKKAVACAKFIPPLLFTNPVGLEGAFSTLRLGMAWNDRLAIAKVVSLYNPKAEELIGFARVTDVIAGNLGDLIEVTAHTNHTFLGSDIADKPTALRRVIRNHYGSNFAADDRNATAIYCERINGKEYQRFKETWTMGRERRR